MPTSAPTRSLNEILAIIHNPNLTTGYPIGDITYYAKNLGAEIVHKQIQLRNILSPQSGVFATRWATKRAHQRVGILQRVYPDIPRCHRPECFGEDGYHSLVAFSGVPSLERTLPFINLEDLGDKTTLSALVEARSRQPPHTFATTERLFMPLGFTDDHRALSHVIRLCDRDGYSESEGFESVTEAVDFVDDGFGLDLGNGLQVLHAQQFLYSFLLQCVRIVLSDHLELFETEIDDPEPDALDIVDEEDKDIAFSEATAMTPYRGRHGLHLHRLRRWTSDAANTAKDEIWQLREDPSQFEKAYNSAVDHDVAQVADRHGKAHPNIKSKGFVASTLNILVARRHRRLVCWDQLDAYARRIGELFSLHPEGVRAWSLEPEELVEAIQSFHVLLELMKRDFLEEMSRYSASEELRSQFVRLPLSTGSHLSAHKNFMKDQNKKEICLLLQELCGELNNKSEHTTSFLEIRVRLDILETFLQKKPKLRDLLSTPIKEAIARLSVLTECSHLLELQPWNFKVWKMLAVTESVKARVNSRVAEPLQVWDRVLIAAMDTGFITSPELGDPSDGKFTYPYEESRRKKKVIDALRKAEANLDRFWRSFDTDFRNRSGGEDQETLRRLLEERGAMRRTKAWVNDRPEKETGHLSAEDVFEPQPVSQIFHDPSKEITGNLDKFAIAKKAKDKTRGTAAAVPADEPDIEDEPAPDTFVDPLRPWTRLGDNSYKVLKALFFIPDEDKVPGVTKWAAFRTTMTHLGFSAEQMQGSAWQFTPSEQLRQDRSLDRGICFHEPHPGNEMSLAMMRTLGARLTRAYGWDGSMFNQQ
ncbi:hypothetical protein J4E80_002064 [Alternaria sp. BMP 0032]|nr:hypothetical protein J4E80_002064 [Alternaria sp. BMP 0032]